MWTSTWGERAPLSAKIYVTNGQRNVSLQERKALQSLIPLQALEVSNYCKRLALPQFLTPHWVNLPRWSTRASASFLSYLRSVLLIFPVYFQTTDFSHYQASFFARNSEYHSNHSVSCLASKHVFHLRLLVQFVPLPKEVSPHDPCSHWFPDQISFLGEAISYLEITSCHHFLFQHVCKARCPHTRFFLSWHHNPHSQTTLVPATFEWNDLLHSGLCVSERRYNQYQKILNCVLRPNCSSSHSRQGHNTRSPFFAS